MMRAAAPLLPTPRARVGSISVGWAAAPHAAAMQPQAATAKWAGPRPPSDPPPAQSLGVAARPKKKARPSAEAAAKASAEASAEASVPVLEGDNRTARRAAWEVVEQRRAEFHAADAAVAAAHVASRLAWGRLEEARDALEAWGDSLYNGAPMRRP